MKDNVVEEEPEITIFLTPARTVYQEAKSLIDEMLEVVETINLAVPDGIKAYLRPSDAAQLNGMARRITAVSIPEFRAGQMGGEAHAQLLNAQHPIMRFLTPQISDSDKDVIGALKSSRDLSNFDYHDEHVLGYNPLEEFARDLSEEEEMEESFSMNLFD